MSTPNKDNQVYSVCECGHAAIDHRKEKDHVECQVRGCECDTLRPAAQPQRSKIRPEDWSVLDKFLPQRIEQQEWTAERDGAICGVLKGNGEVVETGLHFALCERLAKTITTALAAERQRREQAERDMRLAKRMADAAFKKLLSAQAAIENLNRIQDRWAKNQATNVELQHAFKALDAVDLTALHEHDAEVRKPLVDALREIANSTNSHIANDALAKEDK